LKFSYIHSQSFLISQPSALVTEAIKDFDYSPHPSLCHKDDVID
jgi:hypothetical protein